jgi:glycosyltransferase involved in cell wall biosynthesis
MKIGVDLRVLQVGHQYRGIGEVSKQCLNRIFERAVGDKKNRPTFVFYEYDDEIDPKEYLSIPAELEYEEVYLGKRPSPDIPRSGGEKVTNKWRRWFGVPIPNANKCDVFLQFQFELGVPRHPKTVLIAHDLIPLVYWNDYFESPWVPFKNKAARTTLRTIMHNNEYKRVLRRAHRNASRIICVSDSTRKDLHEYLHVPNKKMEVALLGVSPKPASTGKTSQKPANYPTKPFLLFVGGIDKRRRRVDDLVAAFNNLKASGHDIQLALVGENFQAPEKIPDEIVRKDVMGSSYAKDILTLGYIDDETKQRLYKEAIAFVFPTTYEGFGIMTLEAMLLECPVIAYSNSSIPEVGGDYALYAKNWHDIWQQTERLLAMPVTKRQAFIAAAKKHAEQFTWESTAEAVYHSLIKIVS